jgi:phosphoserine phosphatase
MQAVDQNQLLTEIRSQSRPDSAWVFDCDGTLVEGDVGTVGVWGVLQSGLADPTRTPEEWLYDNIKNKTFARFYDERLTMAQKIGFSIVFEWETLLLGGLPRAKAERITRDAIEMAFGDGDLSFISPLADLARERSNRAWIVSGSPSVTVNQIAEKLEIDVSRVIATELNEVDGILMPSFTDAGIVWAEKKRELLEARNVLPYFVAGDSTGDWDMFMLSSRWIWCVIRPATRKTGYRLETRLEDHFRSTKLEIPRQKGVYRFEEGDRSWIFDVRAE